MRRIRKPKVLTPQRHKPKSLVAFFAQSPLEKTKIKLKRKREFGRKISL